VSAIPYVHDDEASEQAVTPQPSVVHGLPSSQAAHARTPWNDIKHDNILMLPLSSESDAIPSRPSGGEVGPQD
jgi:hypothetical protein